MTALLTLQAKIVSSEDNSKQVLTFAPFHNPYIKENDTEVWLLLYPSKWLKPVITSAMITHMMMSDDYTLMFFPNFKETAENFKTTTIDWDDEGQRTDMKIYAIVYDYLAKLEEEDE